jgi:hypothetical protein
VLIKHLFEHAAAAVKKAGKQKTILHFSDLSAVAANALQLRNFLEILSAESAKYPDIVAVVSITPALQQQKSAAAVALHSHPAVKALELQAAGGINALSINVLPPPVSASANNKRSDLTDWMRRMQEGRGKRLLCRNLFACQLACRRLGVQLTDGWEKTAIAGDDEWKSLLSVQILPADSIRQALTIAYGRTIEGEGDVNEEEEEVEGKRQIPPADFLAALRGQLSAAADKSKRSALRNKQLQQQHDYAADDQMSPQQILLNSLDEKSLNSYEKRLLPTIIPPTATRVRFRDIAALAKTKETLQTLIALPLLRPSMFQYGVLRDNVSGLLLFGPPGIFFTKVLHII